MEFQGELRHNEKRAAFLDYADLPTRTSTPLELALCLAPGDEEDVRFLERGGWSIRHAWTVSSGPEQYRAYIQRSRGEFSVVKPSCVWLGNAWISDRTLCYLASAKPAVVQHTGPSRFLPDSEGLFRFRNMEEATRALTAVESDHERHRRLARELAEEHFVRSESRWTRAGAGAGMRGPRSCQSLAILGYHKIGEPPAGGWRTWFYVPEEIFVGHLGYLREHGWQVIDLPALLSGITAPESLP